VLALTTDPGLEDLAVDELRALAGPSVVGRLRPYGLPGHLDVQAEVPDLAALALRMRSIHHVVRPLSRFEVPDVDPLGHVRRTVAGIAACIPELAPVDATFRVSCSRTGDHPFTSEDVEREAGAGVRDALFRRVRLKGMDVELRCDIRGAIGLLGVKLTRASLSRRAGPYRPHTSLRASVAWSMLQLARPQAPPSVLLDPFVGAGTILVEAAARWPGAALCGSDREARCVEGARLNLGARADLRQGDARRLAERWPDRRFDTVVTNPPCGHRLASDVDLRALYRAFLAEAAERATEDARMVLLVQRRGDFNRALRTVPRWEIRHVRIVELGGQYVGMFVLSRV
jgi:putative N6-adenine-specific DNA methylase/tRNA (guanine6-N2)-methyltransferase